MSELLRLRLDLSYDGTSFSGWAMQPGLRTVEGELSAGLTMILRSATAIRLVVAGRTDAGVHARGQVVHADVNPAQWAALPTRAHGDPAQAAVARLAGVLPPEIVVHQVVPAAAGFDARFSAIERRYSYRILDQPHLLDPLRRRDTVLLRTELDVDRMNEAAVQLIGLADFAAFCRPRVGATTIRTLLEYTWQRAPDGVIQGQIRADAFCHSMVRALVGAVIPVGQRRQGIGWPREVLLAKERNGAVIVMPAKGLSLEEVRYPPDAELGVRSVTARVRRTL